MSDQVCPTCSSDGPATCQRGGAINAHAYGTNPFKHPHSCCPDNFHSSPAGVAPTKADYAKKFRYEVTKTGHCTLWRPHGDCS